MRLVQLLGLSATALSAPTAPSCTRAALQAQADSYIAAQKAGSASRLSTTVSSETVYTENFKPVALASGILATALPIDHARTSIDTTQCATYTELISATGPAAYVIGTQIWFDDTGAKIQKIESIITTKGDWLFNATSTLSWASKEDWGAIPEDKRDSRAVIKAAGDAYLDIFSVCSPSKLRCSSFNILSPNIYAPTSIYCILSPTSVYNEPSGITDIRDRIQSSHYASEIKHRAAKLS